MIPSVTDVREWDWETVGERGAATAKVSSVFGQLQDRIRTATRDLWYDWVGVAATAAHDHLDREDRCGKRIVDELETIASTIRRVDDALGFAVQVARAKIVAAEQAGFVVTDNGVTEGEGFSGVYDGEPDAAAHWGIIQSALRTVGDVDSEGARWIRSCVSDLIDVTPEPAVFSPDEAAHDWAMLTDGTITTEELGRFTANLVAAGLDPHLLDQLAQGQVVTALPAGAFDYLQDFYARAGVDGLMELQRQLENDGSPASLDARADLANGLLILSNEHVRDADDVRGGWDRLPREVRDLVEARPGTPTPGYTVPATLTGFLDALPSDVRSALEAEPGAAARAHRDALAHVGDAAYVDAVLRGRDFWEFVGSDGAIPGVDLGTKLVESAASQATAIDSIGTHPPGPFDTVPIPVPHAGESMLDVATTNRDVSARVLTGDLDGDGRPDIDRDRLLTPLFTHSWDDEGESVGRLTDWMTEEIGAAHNDGTGTPVDRAEQSALALAQYLSHEKNYDTLMDVHGENTSNIGEVNPHLVRAFAEGLHGYIPELVQADLSGAWALNDLEPVDDFRHAQRVFTLMATDPESSATFGNAATTFTRHFAAEYTDDSSISRESAAFAGRLQALMDKGIHNAADEIFDDDRARDEFAQQRRADAYTTNYTVIRNLVALDPRLSGTVGVLMDLNSSDLQSAFVPAFDDRESSPFTGDFADYSALNSFLLLESAVAQHGLPQDDRALANLREAAILGDDGVLSYPTGNAASSVQITAALDSALRASGIDLGDYRTYYMDGYAQVTPTVRVGREETTPR